MLQCLNENTTINPAFERAAKKASGLPYHPAPPPHQSLVELHSTPCTRASSADAFRNHHDIGLYSTSKMKLSQIADACRDHLVDGSVRYGGIDCGGKLPSNKTFFQRFKLAKANFTATPVGFLFANGDVPEKVRILSVRPCVHCTRWLGLCIIVEDHN